MNLVRVVLDRHGDHWAIRSGRAAAVHYAGEPGKWLPVVHVHAWPASRVETEYGPLVDVTTYAGLPVPLPAGWLLAPTVLGPVP